MNKETNKRNNSVTTDANENEKALLNLKELCAYTGWGMSKARKVVKRPSNGFTVKLGNKYFVHKKLFDEYLLRCARYDITI